MPAWYTAAKMQAFSLYLHIPFCHHRCSYCDFNTYSGKEVLIPDYVEALCRELTYLAQSAPQRIPLHTIFFGGGTPSILPIKALEQIFGTIRREFDIQNGVEISLEANPGKLNSEYLKSVHNLGVNRISLGMQSASREDLNLLDRQHDFQQVASAVSIIKDAGFLNFNLDLIYGIPYQNLASWQKTLDQSLSLSPTHFSLYSLTIEKDTRMGNWVRDGFVPEPDQDIAAEMYEIAGEVLSTQGFEQYEISNWAKRDQDGDLMSCDHNLQYWRNLPYLGVGAGAHGFSMGIRTENEPFPEKYIRILSYLTDMPDKDLLPFPSTPATVNKNTVSQREEMKETMFMGLRLTQEGISRKVFFERFGIELEKAFSQEIDQLLEAGLLMWDSNDKKVLKLTPRGRLLGNQVFMQFV